MVDATGIGSCQINGSEADVARDNDGPKAKSIKMDIVISTYTS